MPKDTSYFDFDELEIKYEKREEEKLDACACSSQKGEHKMVSLEKSFGEAAVFAGEAVPDVHHTPKGSHVKEDDFLKPGTPVWLMNMSSPEFNGLKAVVIALHDSKERYNVRLVKDGMIKGVRLACLQTTPVENAELLRLEQPLINAICWERLEQMFHRVPNLDLQRSLPGTPLLPTALDLKNGYKQYNAIQNEAGRKVLCWSSLPALEANYRERLQSATSAATSDSTASVDKYLVSVICPTTKARRSFHGTLYECFKCQTHERRELIILETCEEGPSDFWLAVARKDSRVIYKNLEVPPNAFNVGFKRNLACALGAGQIIAHFDDDDLYAPCYLEVMLRHMLAPNPSDVETTSPGDVEDTPPESRKRIQPKSGLTDSQRLQQGLALARGPFGAASAKLSTWLKFMVMGGTWGLCNPRFSTGQKKSRHERDNCLFGWGFSLVYLRTAWLLCPFPDRQIGEDYEFLVAMLGVGFHIALPRDIGGMCCHTSHGKNTSGRAMESTQNVNRTTLASSAIAPLLTTYLKAFDEYKSEQLT